MSDNESFTTPLHPAQSEVYYDQLMHEDSPCYNIGALVRLQGTLRKADLIKAIESLPDAFNIYNAGFIFERSPLVRFTEKVDTHILEEDFSNRKNALKDMLNYVRQRMNIPFSVHTEDPLFEHILFKINDDDHYWFYRCHHLLSDELGLQIAIHYVAQQYRSLVRNKKLRIRRFDYSSQIERDNAYLRSSQYQKDAAYWKEKFGEIPGPLLLPQYPDKKYLVQSDVYAARIPNNIKNLIVGLKASYGINVSQVIMAALSVYFSRTSEQQDLVFGITLHNRKNIEQMQMVGMFSKIVPAIINTANDPTLKELLDRIVQQKENDSPHKNYPISHLNRYLKLLEKDREQLYEIAINYKPFDLDFSAPDLQAKTTRLYSGQESTPLNIIITEDRKSGKWLLRIDFRKSYFKKPEIVLLTERILHIISQFDNPDQRISETELLTKKEKDRILSVFNTTPVPYDRSVTLLDLFEAQVRRSKTETAVVFEDQSFTYAELDAKANQLARYLSDNGVRNGSMVMIRLNTSLEMILAIWGILKAGAAYVPVDVSNPVQRSEYIQSDTKSILTLDKEEMKKFYTNIENYPSVKYDAGIKSENLAYVIYTSGTTGEPKGVSVEHRSVVNLIKGLHEGIYAGYSGERMNISLLANYSFDASVQQIMYALCKGHCLYVIPHELKTRPEALWKYLLEKKIEICDGTPSLWELLSAGTPITDHNGALKHLIIGGEELTRDLVVKIKQKVPTLKKNLRITNIYGPTECTVDSTLFHPPSSMAHIPEGKIPIGKPMLNTVAYVLDERKRMVPIGARGELHIGGFQLSRGYLNKADLTEKSFIDNPYGPGKLYKTGDMVRWLTNGNLEFLGRNDRQVKISGYRVELGKIENSIFQFREVRNCAVLLTGKGAAKKLTAYIVFDEPLKIEVIKQRLTLSLPEYMIPTLFVELDKIPITQNGKLDTKSFPDPGDHYLSEQQFTEPATYTEKRIALVWQEILEINNIPGVDDNFFEIGGTSLLAVMLVCKIEEEFGIKYLIRDLIKGPTIKQCAALIDQKAVPQKNNLISLKEEAFLPPEIIPPVAKNKNKPVKNILLTGSSGFIGKYLLLELLEKTTARIYCLLRCETEEEGMQRLITAMADNDLPTSAMLSRVHIVKGNLEKERLGLSTAGFIFLAKTIEVIYHNGSQVHHLSTYDQLKAANVGGTRELIRLACMHRLKSIHYISTLSVFSESGTKRSIDETYTLKNERHTAEDGYAASKWVGEQLITIARERGIPCNIYRLGLISGDSERGRHATYQWFYRLLDSCLRIGCFYNDSSVKLSIVPVNVAARSIIFLSGQEQLKNKVFHITNPGKISLKEIFDVYNIMNGNSDHHVMKEVSFVEWINIARSYVNKDGELPILPLFYDYMQMDQEQLKEEHLNVRIKPLILLEFRQEFTLKELKKGSVEIPEIDEQMIRLYLQPFLQKQHQNVTANY